MRFSNSFFKVLLVFGLIVSVYADTKLFNFTLNGINYNANNNNFVSNIAPYDYFFPKKDHYLNEGLTLFTANYDYPGVVRINMQINPSYETINVYKLSDSPKLIKTLNGTECGIEGVFCSTVYLEAGEYAFMYISNKNYSNPKDEQAPINFEFYPQTNNTNTCTPIYQGVDCDIGWEKAVLRKKLKQDIENMKFLTLYKVNNVEGATQLNESFMMVDRMLDTLLIETSTTPIDVALTASDRMYKEIANDGKIDSLDYMSEIYDTGVTIYQLFKEPYNPTSWVGAAKTLEGNAVALADVWVKTFNTKDIQRKWNDYWVANKIVYDWIYGNNGGFNGVVTISEQTSTKLSDVAEAYFNKFNHFDWQFPDPFDKYDSALIVTDMITKLSNYANRKKSLYKLYEDVDHDGISNVDEVANGTDPNTPENHRPKASFKFNRTSINVGEMVTATSTSTDEDGDVLIYTWTLIKPNGSNISLTYNSDKSIAFFTPDIEGIYSLWLNVSDGKLYYNTHNDISTVNTTSTKKYSPLATRISPEYSTYAHAGDQIYFKVKGVDPDNGLSYVNYRVEGEAILGDSYDNFNDIHDDTANTYITVKSDIAGTDNLIAVYADVYDVDGNKATTKWVVHARASASPILTPITYQAGNINVPLGKVVFDVNVSDNDDNTRVVNWYLDGILVDQSTVGGGIPATVESHTETFSQRSLHVLKAVAQDDDGNMKEVIWSIEAGSPTDGNLAPSIEYFWLYTSDIQYQIFRLNRGYEFDCESSDPDKNLIYMSLYKDGVLVREDTNSIALANDHIASYIAFSTLGEHALKCVARDDAGVETNKTITVNVVEKDVSSGTAPEFTKFYPTSSIIYGNDSIPFLGAIQDDDLDAEKVEVYLDNVLLKEDDKISYEGSFRFYLQQDELPTSGTHQLKFVPVDINGNRGTPINKTLYIAQNGNQTPKIKKVIPNDDTPIYVASGTTVKPFVFAEDPDGDLDRVEWNMYGVAEPDPTDSDSIGGYFDRSSNAVHPAQSGTVIATVYDKAGHSSSVSFDIQVVSNVQQHNPKIINFSLTNGAQYIKNENNDPGINFDVFDPDWDLVSVSLYKNGVLYKTASTHSYFDNSVDSQADSVQTYSFYNLKRGETNVYTIRATDSQGNIDEKTFTITQGPVGIKDHAPDVNKTIGLSLDQRSSLEFSIDYLDEENDESNVTIANISNEGYVKYLGNHRFQYIPDEDYYGVETFTIVWNDNYGGISETNVTAYIGRVIRPPVLTKTDMTVIIDKNALYNLASVLSFFTSSDIYSNDVLVFEPFSKTGILLSDSKNLNPTNGLQIRLEQNKIEGTLQGVVKDPDGRESVPLTIHILRNNAVPVFDDFVLTVKQNVIYNGQFNAVDIDGDALVYSLEKDALNGSVSVGLDGNFTYIPNLNYDGNDTFTVKVQDTRGASDVAITSVVIVNDDIDGDGMPNDWETINSLDPHINDAGLDPDNDGFTNFEEYILGTNPQNPLSKQYTINIDANWTLISLPIAGTLHVDNINNTDIKIIRSYQNGQWSNWTSINQVTSEQPLTELTENHGYWIKSNAPTTINYIGNSLPTPIDFSTQNGQWKMYGSTQIDDPSAFLSAHPNITVLWKYSNGQWQAISNNVDIQSDLDNAGIAPLTFINSDEAFWAK